MDGDAERRRHSLPLSWHRSCFHLGRLKVRVIIYIHVLYNSHSHTLYCHPYTVA